MAILYGIGSMLIWLCVPLLIVGLWRRRPVLAMVTALVVLFVTMITRGVIITSQAMMTYGDDPPYTAADPMLTPDYLPLISPAISEAIVSGIIILIVYLPVLLVFQFFVRRWFKKKHARETSEDTFP